MQLSNATNEGIRRKPVDVKSLDFKAYALVSSSLVPGGADDNNHRGRDIITDFSVAAVQRASVRASIRASIALTNVLSPSMKGGSRVLPVLPVLPTLMPTSSPSSPSSVLSAGVGTIMSDFRPSSPPNSRGASHHQTDVEGHALAYVHSSPDVLSSSFFDVSGQHFALHGALVGGGGGGGGGQTLGVGSKVPSAAAQRPDSPPHGSAVAATIVDIFAPLLLHRNGDNDLYVSMYRKVRNDTGVVAELLSRLRRDEGDGKTAAVLYFEAADMADLWLDATVSAELKERRALVSRTYKVVAGEERGCIVMVRSFLTGFSPPSSHTLL